ncbi:MAG TPA: hypothetical protein VNF68_11420 [Candidatus Baltobacteraceae bacterium]|nr:hypothetical protein [Candidatus Baltobacteraceae bacterium]
MAPAWRIAWSIEQLEFQYADAVSALRDPAHFSWTIVPLFVIVVYLYFRQAEMNNWARILAAVAPRHRRDRAGALSVARMDLDRLEPHGTSQLY